MAMILPLPFKANFEIRNTYHFSTPCYIEMTWTMGGNLHSYRKNVNFAQNNEEAINEMLRTFWRRLGAL